MLTHWVRGMRAAMKMKPEEEDLGIVKRELALYVVSKLERAAGRVTWYDHLCLFTVGEMMEQWGSLRLISQEGMEGCQKKLNEISASTSSASSTCSDRGEAEADAVASAGMRACSILPAVLRGAAAGAQCVLGGRERRLVRAQPRREGAQGARADA